MSENETNSDGMETVFDAPMAPIEAETVTLPDLAAKVVLLRGLCEVMAKRLDLQGVHAVTLGDALEAAMEREERALAQARELARLVGALNERLETLEREVRVPRGWR